jgi:hypothetical protein
MLNHAFVKGEHAFTDEGYSYLVGHSPKVDDLPHLTYLEWMVKEEGPCSDEWLSLDSAL